MSLLEKLAIPEKYIPFGYYCYENSRNVTCPFWDMKQGVYPPHEDGYCYYLNASDWDLNEQAGARKVIYINDSSAIPGYLEDTNDIDPISGKKTHFTSSLIWDQVKECGINMEEPDDTKIVRFNSETLEKVFTTVGDIKKGK